MNSPFILENHTEYKEWRDLKLLNYPVQKNKLIFKFDKNIVDEKVLNLFKSTINDYNFVIYEFGSEVLDAELLNFCSALGLTNSVSNLFSDEDNISNITNQEEKQHLDPSMIFDDLVGPSPSRAVTPSIPFAQLTWETTLTTDVKEDRKSRILERALSFTSSS